MKPTPPISPIIPAKTQANLLLTFLNQSIIKINLNFLSSIALIISFLLILLLHLLLLLLLIAVIILRNIYCLFDFSLRQGLILKDKIGDSFLNYFIKFLILKLIISVPEFSTVFLKKEIPNKLEGGINNKNQSIDCCSMIIWNAHLYNRFKFPWQEIVFYYVILILRFPFLDFKSIWRYSLKYSRYHLWIPELS